MLHDATECNKNKGQLRVMTSKDDKSHSLEGVGVQFGLISDNFT